MKKSIIAILLSLSILCSSMFCVKRASAAAVGVGFNVFLFAWQILDVMTKGQEPGFVVAIRTIIEEGVDAITNPDSPFQQNWRSFWDDWGVCWEALCDYLLFKSEIDISGLIDENGNLILSYEDYYEMYSQAVDVMSKSGVKFTAGYDYTFLSLDLNSVVFLSDLPTMSQFYQSSSYESYCPVYFNSDKVVFSNKYFRIGTDIFDILNISSSYNVGSQFGGSYYNDYHLKHYSVLFSDYPGIRYFLDYSGDNNSGTLISSSNCFVFEDNKLSFQNISSVDLSGMNFGLITTTGNFVNFLRSLKGFTAFEGNGDKLDDLANALPTEKNPTLTFPLDYDYTKPTINQVIVGDVPGAADLPVSDYLKAASVPAAAPPVILTKFPFCIPYDLVRFLGFLAADPIPPVFHIPISTQPQNLSQWADNETIGQYVAPDDPMFEINEEIVLDFAHIPLVQPICYTCFIVGFVILLIHITPKLIHH